MNQLAIFLLPSLWIVGSLSIVIPNLIEQDATNPPKQGLSLLILVTIVLLIMTASSANMLSNFVLLGGAIPVIAALVAYSIKH